MLEFVVDFLEPADIDGGKVRVGVLGVSTSEVMVINLNFFLNKTELFKAIREIPHMPGKLNIAGSLRSIRNYMFVPHRGDRYDVPNAVILITGGESDINKKWTVLSARATRRQSVTIYGVGVGLNSTRELNYIVSQPVRNHRVLAPDFFSLDTVKKPLIWAVFGGKIE